MFDNVGSKVKVMATVFCIIGIIASVILGIVALVGGQGIVGLIIIALGAFSSWLSCLALYAIGHSAEAVDSMCFRLECIEKKLSSGQSQPQSQNQPEMSKQELYKKMQAAVQKAEEGGWWCSCGAKNSKDAKECATCYKKKP